MDDPTETVQPQIQEMIEEKPSYLLWVIGYLVSTLVTGAFFLTGLFLAVGTGNKETLMGGVFMGFIPGLIGGATFGGLVYSIYEKWAKRAVTVALLTIVIPLVAIPFAFGLVSGFSILLAPIGTIIGGLGTPGLVWSYRKRGMGKIKSPEGSWEDNF
jgi:hypothetical protein